MAPQILWLLSLIPDETKIDVLHGLGKIYTDSTENKTDDKALKILIKLLRAGNDPAKIVPLILDLMELAADLTSNDVDNNIIDSLRALIEDNKK